MVANGSSWRRWVSEAALPAVAVAPALVDQATTDPSAVAWWTLVAYCAVVVAGLGVRRRWPLSAFAAILLALTAAEIWVASLEAKLSTLAVLPLAFGLYAVGAHRALPASMAAVLGGGVVVAAGLWINNATAPEGWRGGSDVLAVVAPLPVVWALGVAARGRRARLAAAERRADDALLEQAALVDRAAQAERVRIARDMHDVVAHSLSLLVVRAETVRARSGELPAWAKSEIDAVASAGRQATAELRDLLRVLRDGMDPTASRLPTPTLATLSELVGGSRSGGNPATLTTRGDLASPARSIQLAAYRVVQESLANAHRHAPGAEVGVRVEVTPDQAQVEVSCAPPLPGTVPAPGTGLGLLGMRERVSSLGGHLEAGPAPGGGFAVSAVLPLDSPYGGPHATR
jgi:signal transduction histidine kinase